MSSTGEIAREIASQSSTAMVPSGTFRHDLDGAAFGGRYLDPHQPVAELFDDRLGDGRDARGQPRLDDQPWFRLVRCGVCRLSRLACGHSSNKKERAREDPLSKPVRL